MKKIGCVFLAVSMAFGLCACKPNAYDYSSEELKITELDCFAPCWFWDFFYQNEHTKTHFSEAMSIAVYQSAYFEVTIKGERWTPLQISQNELPQGFYDIVIETPSDFYLVENTSEGLKRIPYHKKLTVSVFVWELNADKYPDILQ